MLKRGDQQGQRGMAEVRKGKSSHENKELKKAE